MTEITDENVFTRCPDCGSEIAVDLSDLADEDSSTCLPWASAARCSRARWKAAHADERSACHGHQ